MKKIIVMLAVLALLTSCSSTPYWEVSKRTASGKHTYMLPGWPHEHRCAGMYSRNPIKASAVHRYQFTPKHVRQ